MMIRVILSLLIFLWAGQAWATIYYVSTTGSNTSPYDTWAKAANKLTTISALNPGGTGSSVYIAPGTYTEASSASFTVAVSNWTGGLIYGVSAAGVAVPCVSTACQSYPAAKGEVIISTSATPGIRVSRDNFTIKNISITGGTNSTSILLWFYNNANFTGDNLYLYDSQGFQFQSDTGAGFTITNSLFSGSKGANELLMAAGSTAGNVSRSIFQNSPSNRAGATTTIKNNSTGTLTLNNIVVTGSGGSPLTAGVSGSTITINNSVLISADSNSYPEVFTTVSGSTVNASNNILLSGIRSPGTLTAGTGTVNLSGNIYQGPYFNRHARSGYLSIVTPNEEDSAYALDVASKLKARGLRGGILTLNNRYGTTYDATIQAVAATGSYEIGLISQNHTDLTMTTAMTVTNTGAACTNVQNDRTGNGTITVTGTGGGAITPVKTVAISALKTAMEAMGCTVSYTTGSSGVTLAPVLGEALDTCNHSTSGGYAMPLLIDTTGNTGYFKTEVKDLITNIAGRFPALTMRTLDPGYLASNDNVSALAYNLGLQNCFQEISVSGASWKLDSIDLMKLAVVANTTFTGATDALTRQYADQLFEIVAQNGLWIIMQSHSAAEVSLAQWDIILDELAKYPEITMDLPSNITAAIKSAPWSDDSANHGGVTGRYYVRTWTDQSNYRLRPESPGVYGGISPCTSTGVPLACCVDTTMTGCTDYDGLPSPIPGAPGSSIGIYEPWRTRKIF